MPLDKNQLTPAPGDSEVAQQQQEKPTLSSDVWDDIMADSKSAKMQLAGSVTCRWYDDYGNTGYGTCDFEAGTVHKW